MFDVLAPDVGLQQVATSPQVGDNIGLYHHAGRRGGSMCAQSCWWRSRWQCTIPLAWGNNHTRTIIRTTSLLNFLILDSSRGLHRAPETQDVGARETHLESYGCRHLCQRGSGDISLITGRGGVLRATVGVEVCRHAWAPCAPVVTRWC